MKDTRAHAFIGNRDSGTHCDECQCELVGYERFVCCRCDPNAHEWEWEDRCGEIWRDTARGTFLVLSEHERDPRMLECLVLDGYEAPRYASWPSWEQGQIVTYPRSAFAEPPPEWDDIVYLERLL